MKNFLIIGFINFLVFVICGVIIVYCRALLGMDISSHSALWVVPPVYLVTLIVGGVLDYFTGRYMGIISIENIFDKVIGYCICGLVWVALVFYFTFSQ